MDHADSGLQNGGGEKSIFSQKTLNIDKFLLVLLLEMDLLLQHRSVAAASGLIVPACSSSGDGWIHHLKCKSQLISAAERYMHIFLLSIIHLQQFKGSGNCICQWR